ncbi:MAG: hypothetical protein PQJ50_02470 [Spirochaetales bacterium]|nr:hypothetical protein [Spirochaetales bacterium]
MNLTNTFDPKRFYLLFRKDLLQGYKTLIITAAAVLGASFIILFISTAGGRYGGGAGSAATGLFFPLLWGGGLIFTSMVFKEAHSANRIHYWLMTPASRLEKFLEKLLLSTVFYVLALMVVFFAATGLNSLVFRIFFDYSPGVFNPFTRYVWINVGNYMIVQSIFFLGAIWFRKYNFIKTVLTINVLQLALTIILGGLGYLIFRAPIREAMLGNSVYFMNAGQILTQNFIRMNSTLVVLLKILYFGLLAPFFWFLSWMRMREVEIKDGI